MSNDNITISVTDIMSQAEASSELGITAMTLWRWLRDGKIIAVRFGRYRMIPRSEVERIKSQKGR